MKGKLKGNMGTMSYERRRKKEIKGDQRKMFLPLCIRVARGTTGKKDLEFSTSGKTSEIAHCGRTWKRGEDWKGRKVLQVPTKNKVLEQTIMM